MRPAAGDARVGSDGEPTRDGLPDPDEAPCVDCGHVWFEGERRHEYVTGQPAPGFRVGQVEVVCVLCRRQRERRPAED
jgi:hypothetical protein